MSSSKDKDGNITFMCDDCGEEVGGEFSDFREAFHESGFTYFGNNYHRCEECTEIYKELMK